MLSRENLSDHSRTTGVDGRGIGEALGPSGNRPSTKTFRVILKDWRITDAVSGQRGIRTIGPPVRISVALLSCKAAQGRLRLQDAERYRGFAHVLPTPRGRMLAHAGSAAQEVSELVVGRGNIGSPIQCSSIRALVDIGPYAAVILLKSVVQIATCTMPHMAAKLGPDCPGIRIVAVRGDPIRDYAGHRLCRSKEGLLGGKVAVLTQEARLRTSVDDEKAKSAEAGTSMRHIFGCVVVGSICIARSIALAPWST